MKEIIDYLKADPMRTLIYGLVLFFGITYLYERFATPQEDKTYDRIIERIEQDSVIHARQQIRIDSLVRLTEQLEGGVRVLRKEVSKQKTITDGLLEDIADIDRSLPPLPDF